MELSEGWLCLGEQVINSDFRSATCGGAAIWVGLHYYASVKMHLDISAIRQAAAFGHLSQCVKTPGMYFII